MKQEGRCVLTLWDWEVEKAREGTVGIRTARMRISISLFEEPRPRAEEMWEAQEVVSSVVVLWKERKE